MYNYRKTSLCVLFVFWCFQLRAQSSRDQFIQNSETLSKPGIWDANAVKKLYALNEYRLLWTGNKMTAQRDTLLSLLAESEAFGLNEKDYQFEFIKNYRSGRIKLINISDTVNAEIHFADAALHFFNDILSGNKPPVLGYDALHYKPSYDIAQLLYTHYQDNNFRQWLTEANDRSPEIGSIIQKLQWMQKEISQKDFADINVNDKKTSVVNRQLIGRLCQLGLLDSTKVLSEPQLKQKIKIAQQSFDLLSDGVLRSTFLEELNIPLDTRVNQLIASLNYYRWLQCFRQEQKVIVVNIPAAYLKVYGKDTVILQMKMIVGKKATPTPTLLGIADEVVLYPYWHVPYSIATKELLPVIKRNIAFLEQGNYQVLNSNGKVMDPYKINWRILSRSYFPYIIRQGTGCDNSLGLLKINFYSPFGVYLHDTPAAFLFGTNKRFYSHGCMRMEKPFELGHLLLKDNSIAIDTLEEKGCILNQSPVVVPVREKMPVLVWYNPVAINDNGILVFYEDVYGKFFRKK